MKNSSLPYFRFYPKDYLAGDIQACSFTTQGVFANLLCYLWCKGGFIKASDKYVTKLLRIPEMDWQTARQELEEFGILRTRDGTLYVSFLAEQYEMLNETHQKLVAAGKRGGRPRKSQAKATLSEAESQPEATPKHPDPDPDPDPKIPPKGPPVGGEVDQHRIEIDPRTARAEALTPLMQEIGAWFDRPKTALWSAADYRILKALGLDKLPPEDLGEQITAFRRWFLATEEERPADEWHPRRTLAKVIRNWDEELDKARAWWIQAPRRVRSKTDAWIEKHMEKWPCQSQKTKESNEVG